MKKLLSIFFPLFLMFILLTPQVVSSYDFVSDLRESQVKLTRREIYDLYNLYKDILVQGDSKFGLYNYNGACNTVTVSGYGTMPLEEYILGVVYHEIGAIGLSDHPETYKAAAIAARSFLIGDSRNQTSCNVTDTGQGYQAYKPVDKNNSSVQRISELVEETAGMVVVKDEKVVQTLYQSYPCDNWYVKDDSSGWSVKFDRWADGKDVWVWNGPSKSTVFNTPGVWGTDIRAMGGDCRHNWGMSQTIAMYLATAEHYTYDKIIDLFYAQPIMLLSDGNYTGNVKYIKNSQFGNVTYYNQNNYKQYYSSEPTSKNEYGATIATHGCGPTAVAIVASSLLGTNVTPISATEKICARNGCTSGGTLIKYVKESLAHDYGLKVEATKDPAEVIRKLETGKALVIVLVGRGKFTSAAGHYIVLAGSNTKGQVQLIDPASDKKTGKWYSFNDVAEERQPNADFLIITK